LAAEGTPIRHEALLPAAFFTRALDVRSSSKASRAAATTASQA